MTGTNVVPLKAGGQILGIVPQNIEEAFRLAGGIAQSGLAPKDMATPEKVLVAIMTGMELGLPPMFAVQKIAVINGRPSLWGDAIPALLYAKGFKLKEWTDGDTAYCEVTRPTGEKIVRTFSDADAKAAGLLGKSGPWTQYRSRMRQMRARGFAARDGAADVLGGLYIREEIEEPIKDITPRHEEAPLALPDIPDVPDLPVDEPPQEAPDEEADAPLEDVDGFLEQLTEQRGWCESETEVQELLESMEDLIARLPDEAKERAEEILRIEE